MRSVLSLHVGHIEARADADDVRNQRHMVRGGSIVQDGNGAYWFPHERKIVVEPYEEEYKGRTKRVSKPKMWSNN